MKKIYMMFFLMSLFLLTGCVFLQKAGVKDPSQNIIIQTPSNIIKSDTVISLTSTETGVSSILLSSRGGSSAPKVTDFSYTVKYIGRVLPILRDDNKTPLQSNDIVLTEDKGFIAYNTSGEEFYGGLQIVDITNEASPEVIKQIALKDMDVHTVYFDSSTNYLYFGGGVNPDIFDFTSYISKIKIDSTLLTKNASDITNEINTNLIKINKSYHTTSIVKSGSDFFVSVGAEKARILQYDSNMILKKETPDNDVRDLAAYSTGVAALTLHEGNKGTGILRMDFFNNGSNIEIGNFTSLEQKSTLEVIETAGKVYTTEDAIVLCGLAQQGFKIVKIDPKKNTSGVVYTLAADNPGNGQISVVNSAAYDGGLVFLAEGEYGFKVLRFNKLFPGFESKSSLLDLVGNHKLQDNKDLYGLASNQNFSFNHIQYKKRVLGSVEMNYLFAAVGTYGVTIYTLTK